MSNTALMDARPVVGILFLLPFHATLEHPAARVPAGRVPHVRMSFDSKVRMIG
eukprot:SAG31_NODE_5953_length_2243_cov_4.189832_2_plen_53_part_00